MSAGYSITAPTEEEIQSFMLETGADYDSAKRSLQLKTALQAINDIQDLDDAKKFLRVLTRRLVGML